MLTWFLTSFRLAVGSAWARPGTRAMEPTVAVASVTAVRGAVIVFLDAR